MIKKRAAVFWKRLILICIENFLSEKKSIFLTKRFSKIFKWAE